MLINFLYHLFSNFGINNYSLKDFFIKIFLKLVKNHFFISSTFDINFIFVQNIITKLSIYFFLIFLYFFNFMFLGKINFHWVNRDVSLMSLFLNYSINLIFILIQALVYNFLFYFFEFLINNFKNTCLIQYLHFFYQKYLNIKIIKINHLFILPLSWVSI